LKTAPLERKLKEGVNDNKLTQDLVIIKIKRKIITRCRNEKLLTYIIKLNKVLCNDDKF
jgi:hypothetical protein